MKLKTFALTISVFAGFYALWVAFFTVDRNSILILILLAVTNFNLAYKINTDRRYKK